MPVLGLSQTAVRPGHALFLVFVGLTYLLIGALEQFRQGELYVRGDALNLSQPLLPCFFKESQKSIPM